MHFYDVDTSTPSMRAYYNKLFHAKRPADQPLCQIIHKVEGVPSTNCDQATAYTHWDMSFSTKCIYDATTGRKQPLVVTFNHRMFLPKWSHIHSAKRRVGAEVMRSLSRTALHEAGHRASGEATAAAIQGLWEALPQQVNPATAPAMCKAFFALVQGFYYKLGRRVTDDNVDTVTRHGYVEGAEYNFRLEPAPKIATMTNAKAEHQALVQFATS